MNSGSILATAWARQSVLWLNGRTQSPNPWFFCPLPPPNYTRKEKRQRQGRNGKSEGAAGRKRWGKGRKRKDQEIAINVCKIHIIWWAQELVLFSVFLRVKISNNQAISNTSIACLPFTDPPECGFCQDLCLFSYIAITRLETFSSIPLDSLHWIYPKACQKAVRENGQKGLNLFIYFSGKWNRGAVNEIQTAKSQASMSNFTPKPLNKCIFFTAFVNDVLCTAGLARRYLYRGQLLSFLRIT